MLGGLKTSSKIVAACNFPGSNDYLSRTHTLSNRKTWTCAFWAERDVTSTLEYLLTTDDGTGSDTGIIFPSTNFFALYDFDDGASSYDIRASGGSGGATGTWTHWTVRVDTTQGTASNRVRLYKDGSILTLSEFNTQPPQNYNTRLGNATGHEIARLSEDGTGDFNGRLADFAMVDGQSLGPEAFYSNGRPIRLNPQWGTGGFWLRFLDGSDLGKDYSGNGNDWTVNGTPNRTIDTP